MGDAADKSDIAERSTSKKTKKSAKGVARKAVEAAPPKTIKDIAKKSATTPSKKTCSCIFNCKRWHKASGVCHYKETRWKMKDAFPSMRSSEGGHIVSLMFSTAKCKGQGKRQWFRGFRMLLWCHHKCILVMGTLFNVTNCWNSTFIYMQTVFTVSCEAIAC